MEGVLIVVVVTKVRQTFTHTCIGNHAISLFGDTLKIVHCTSRDTSDEEFLGRTSAQGCTHFVEHLLLGGNLTLFGHIPRRTECTTTGHDGNLDKGVSIFEEPRESGMSSFV